MDALRTGHVLVAEILIKEHKVQESKSNLKYFTVRLLMLTAVIAIGILKYPALSIVKAVRQKF